MIAGGVNSNVRMRGFPTPLTFASGAGARITDVDGHEYVDYAMGMGPLILGHNDSRVVIAVGEALERGQLFAGQHDAEVELAELLIDSVPGVDCVRIGSTGSEMDLLAIRIARARTGRQRIIRFVGHYHGWLDPLLVDPATTGATAVLGAGQSEAAASDLVVLPWNDADAVTTAFENHGSEIAAVLMEPIMCNVGAIPPASGYIEHVRRLCAGSGSVFIVDEVITGFRVALGGAQQQLGVRGDLTVFAKAIASGFPVAALAGTQDLFAGVASGAVNHSGTYNTGLAQTAAAVATIRALREDPPYQRMESLADALIAGMRDLAERCGRQLAIDRYGSIFQTRFGEPGGVTDAASFAARSDSRALERFLAALQQFGVRPTNRGLWLLSAAHGDAEVDDTLNAVEQALRA